MRMLLLRLLFAIPVVFGLASAAAQAKDCDDCDAYQRGIHRRVVPSNDVVCIFFIQPVRDNVMLRLDLANGKTRRYDAKNAGTSGRICLGRHWVRSASTMFICNGANHAVYNVVDTQAVAVKPKLSRDNEACLYGSASCKGKGYKTAN